MSHVGIYLPYMKNQENMHDVHWSGGEHYRIKEQHGSWK